MNKYQVEGNIRHLVKMHIPEEVDVIFEQLLATNEMRDIKALKFEPQSV